MLQKITSFIFNIYGKVYTFYKQNKDAFYIILIIILITSAFLAYRNLQKGSNVVVEKPGYDSTLSKLLDRNKLLYSELQSVRIESTNFKKQVDSLANALKLKPKVIQGEDRYIFETDTVFTVVPQIVYLGKDTVYRVSKQDNWVNITAYAGRNAGSISYSSVDTLIRVETSKTNIFGKTKDIVYLRNTNPYNNIKAGFSYTKVQKRAYLSLGPSVNYDPFMNKFTVGVSLQYPLIQLKK